MALARSRAALLAAATVAGIALAPAAAPAAGQPALSKGRPASGTLYIEGLGATTALGVSVPFGTSLSNDGPGAAAGLRTLINVSVSGAGARELRVDRRDSSGSWVAIANAAEARGGVTFVDDSTADRWMMAGTVLTSRYRLLLLSRAVSGRAVITAEAQHRLGSAWLTLARSPQYVTKLTPGATHGHGQLSEPSFSPAPTLSPAPSPTTLADDAATGRELVRGSTSSGSAAPWLVASRVGTVISIMVVAGLLAVACWLLRRSTSSGRFLCGEISFDPCRSDRSIR